MPVYIFEEDALEKIIGVEGEDYRHGRATSGPYSFEDFLNKWEEESSKDKVFREIKPEFTIETDHNVAIYGLEGWNRYFVLNSGEILFSGPHSMSEESTLKAKKAGFRIH